MGGMDTELVRATGEREEINKHRAIWAKFAHFIAGNSRFAMFDIHHLTRTVIGIREKREGDDLGFVIWDLGFGQRMASYRLKTSRR